MPRTTVMAASIPTATPSAEQLRLHLRRRDWRPARMDDRP
jgi:hypothetical protein